MKSKSKITLLLLTLMITLGLAVGLPSIAAIGESQALTTQTQTFYQVKDITLQPGSTAGEMNFCWYSPKGNKTCVVQLAQKAQMNGSIFPQTAVSFTGKISSPSKSFNANKVTVSGLAPNTEYVYRVGNGTKFSPAYSFKTEAENDYKAVFLSDAQLTDRSADCASWQKTVTAALDKCDDASFILSAGDQVDVAGSEKLYDNFFKPAELKTVPLVTVIGNHDSGSTLYKYHFNPPNVSASYGVTKAGADYWFRYGDTLYMVLNTTWLTVSSHDAFMKQTVAANQDAKWKIVMFHKSLYSSASHSTDASIVNLRKKLAPVMDKYDIDLVLSGHDHTYTRTYQMLGGVAQKQQQVDKNGAVVDPTGTLYITAGTASGSKYYNIKTKPEAYAAVRYPVKVPVFSTLEVSANSLSITTYRVDTMKIIDTYKMVKN